MKNHGENEARKIWRRYEGRSWKNIGEIMGRFGENPGKNTETPWDAWEKYVIFYPMPGDGEKFDITMKSISKIVV